MAENITISELQTTTEASDSSYIAIDDGVTTQKITVANYNANANATAKHYAEEAETHAGNAATSATSANTEALKAEGFATGNQNGTAQSGGTYYHNNAKYYNEQAASSASDANVYANNASASADSASASAASATAQAQSISEMADQSREGAVSSQSWAVGGTETREGEDTDNAKYYSDRAQAITGLSEFQGATASHAGQLGLVPAPYTGEQNDVLFGSGDWGSLTAAKTSYSNSTSGLSATTTQAAIDALDSSVDTLTTGLTNEIAARTNADSTEVTNRNAAIASEASARESADIALGARIDNIISPSGEAPSAAEVTDARVGTDGTTYLSLGTAIRTQIGNIDNELGSFYYKKLSQTRFIEFPFNVTMNDILYIKPITWTGPSLSNGFTLGAKNTSDADFSAIVTNIGLGEEIYVKFTSNYDIVRLIATSSSLSEDATFEALCAKVDKETTLSGIAFNTMFNKDGMVNPIKKPYISDYLKKESALYFGSEIAINDCFEQGTISTSGVENSDNKYCRSKKYFSLFGVYSISYSINTNYKLAIRYYDKDMNYVTNASGAASTTALVPSGVAYCRFLIFNADGTSNIYPGDVAALTLNIYFNGIDIYKEKQLHSSMLRDFSLVDNYVEKGYLNSAGDVSPNANHDTTDYIFLHKGDAFDYSLLSSAKAVAVYDIHYAKIEVIGEDSVYVPCEGSYTMLQDGYVRFSNRFSYTDKYVRFNKHIPDLVEKEISELREYVNEYVDESGFPIQSYFKDEMDATVEAVLALKKEPCLTFPIITDIHYRYPTTDPAVFDHSIENIKHFLNKVKCDFMLNLGDSSDGRAPLSTQIAYSNYQAIKFAGIDIPYYMVQGNHELNIYQSSTYDGGDKLTNEQIYTLYFNNTPSNVVHNPDCYMDYFVDYPEFAVRLIVLDFSNQNPYKIANATVSWFRDVALDSSKTILLFTHYSPIANHNSYPNVYTDANFATMTSIITSFVNGGGKLVNIYGHSHSDFHFDSPWLQVALNCARPIAADISESAYDYLRENSDIVSPERTVGSVTEDCWTICVVRPLSRKIDFVRFGAGSDRIGLTY